MQVTIPPGLKAANNPTQEHRHRALFYAFLLGLPAVFLTGTGTFAFGSRRQRLALRRLTSVVGISLVLALLVLLPACGGGFKANFGGNTAASFSLTAVGYVWDGANNVQGVEILTVPLNIVK